MIYFIIDQKRGEVEFYFNPCPWNEALVVRGKNTPTKRKGNGLPVKGEADVLHYGADDAPEMLLTSFFNSHGYTVQTINLK